MNKSISILIPAYNAEKYIYKCLESILAQSFSDYEIIVSNDGSTDKTAQEVEKFKLNNPSIDVILINSKNGGVSKARKRALEAASAEWITFVDSDDTLPANALSDLFDSSGDDTDLVVGFLISPKKKIEDLTTPNAWQEAVVNGIIPPNIGGKMYRRSLLTPSMLDIPRNITNGEDMLMNIAYVFKMSKAPRFIYTNIYNYTRQPLSLSHSTKRNLDYEYQYDALRLKAIPQSYHGKYMRGITKYRLNGILGCSRSDTKVIAKKEHPIFKRTREGIKTSGYRLSFFEWIALNSKSPVIIKYSGLLRTVLISLNYRISLLFRK